MTIDHTLSAVCFIDGINVDAYINRLLFAIEPEECTRALTHSDYIMYYSDYLSMANRQFI